MKHRQFTLTFWKLLQAQVCSNGTWDEALEWIRDRHPAGTENNWQKDDDLPPVKCEQSTFRGNSHYMFVC